MNKVKKRKMIVMYKEIFRTHSLNIDLYQQIFAGEKHTPIHWFLNILINHFSRINTAKNFRHDFEMCINDIYFSHWLMVLCERWQTFSNETIFSSFFSTILTQKPSRHSISIKKFFRSCYIFPLSPLPYSSH